MIQEEVKTIEDAAQIRDQYEFDAGHCFYDGKVKMSTTVAARVKKLDRALDEAQYFAEEEEWDEVKHCEDVAIRQARKLNSVLH